MQHMLLMRHDVVMSQSTAIDCIMESIPSARIGPMITEKEVSAHPFGPDQHFDTEAPNDHLSEIRWETYMDTGFHISSKTGRERQGLIQSRRQNTSYFTKTSKQMMASATKSRAPSTEISSKYKSIAPRSMIQLHQCRTGIMAMGKRQPHPWNVNLVRPFSEIWMLSSWKKDDSISRFG